MSYALPSARALRAPDDSARELAAKFGRFLLVTLGLAIMAIGLVTALLPGHLGLPILVVGLMIVLRNSFKARRHFVGIQRAYPKMVFPLRRLLRREPEVAAVFWQQFLRMEKVILPGRHRFARRLRRHLHPRRRRTIFAR